MTYAIIPTGVALIISQLVVNEDDLSEAIRRMVAGLVPMVPEGLVLLTSMAFAVGVISWAAVSAWSRSCRRSRAWRG